MKRSADPGWMILRWCVVAALMAGATRFLYAQDTSFVRKPSAVQLHGYIKYLPSVSFGALVPDLVTGNLIHNRLNFRWDIGDELYVRIEGRNQLYFGEQVKATPGFAGYIEADNGWLDLSVNLIEDSSIVLNSRLDRLLVDWSNEKWEITFGRQRINWGINLVWNPNDIFNAFNYFDFDYEERPGTDAVRVQYSTGDFSSLQFAYQFAKSFSRQAGAFMYKTNIGGYDWQGFAGFYLQDLVAGLGWAGNIGNTGFKGEASYFHPYKNSADTFGVFTTSFSFDRNFKGDYFATVSFLYNSHVDIQGFDFYGFSSVPLSAKNLMPFPFTGFVQVTKSFTPLTQGGMALMYSPTNNSLVFIPTVSVSIAQNWNLSFIGQSLFAEQNNKYAGQFTSLYLQLEWNY